MTYMPKEIAETTWALWRERLAPGWTAELQEVRPALPGEPYWTVTLVGPGPVKTREEIVIEVRAQ